MQLGVVKTSFLLITMGQPQTNQLTRNICPDMKSIRKTVDPQHFATNSNRVCKSTPHIPVQIDFHKILADALRP